MATDPTPEQLGLAREPIVNRGLAQIRSRYPQTHLVKGPHGEALVTVPGFELVSGWTADGEPANICTVLFIRPCGFPAARPEHFFVDIPLRLAKGAHPHCTRVHDEITGFPQWKNITWFSWHLQMWNPNRDSLFSYLMAIRQRLKPAR